MSSIFGPPLLTYNITRVANLSQYDISSFSYMIITGTPFSSEEYAHFNDLLPNVDIIFSYGMTEIGHIALFNPKYDRELMKSKHKSCGKVIPETSLKVCSLLLFTTLDWCLFEGCECRHRRESRTESTRRTSREISELDDRILQKRQLWTV